MIRHPFEGVLENKTDAQSINAVDARQTKTLKPKASSRRSMLQIAIGAFGAAATILPGAAYAQQADGEGGLSLEGSAEGGVGGGSQGNASAGAAGDANLQLESRGGNRQGASNRNHGRSQQRAEAEARRRSRGDDGDEMSTTHYPDDYDEYERWRDRRDERRERRRDRRDRYEDEEWYDRLDSYYFGRNWWGPEYDRRRRDYYYGGRGRYTTQALGEEGGWNRGRRDRNRYTTQALGEEGGYRYRDRRDRYDYWYDDRDRRGRRGRRDDRNDDRNNGRGRYTTYALGEEG